MLFCIPAEYTPEALRALMDNPTTSREKLSKTCCRPLAASLFRCTAPSPTAPVCW